MADKTEEINSKSFLNQGTKTLKHDILADFDDFVLDQKMDSEAKSKALAQLDRLIKQDLFEADTLLKKYQVYNSQKTPNKPQFVSAKLSTKAASKSHNVLDLRQLLEAQKKPQKLNKYKQFFASLKKVNTHKFFAKKEKNEVEEQIVFYQPVEKNSSYRHFTLNFSLIRKLAIFALILAILLSPLRFLVLLGRVKEDKDLIWQLGRNGILNLQSGILSASENAYQSADVDFEEALKNFSEIQQVLNDYDQWILEAGQKLPGFGKSLSVGTNLLKVADNISQAALNLNKKLQAEAPLTEHMLFLEEQIAKTLPYLKEATKNINKVEINSLPAEMQPYFQSLKDYLPKITNNLGDLEDVLVTMSDILGHEKEKRYLVLFQNNNELRATGGFIGSFALLDIYQGQIKNLEIPRGGTYDLSAAQVAKIKAPRALSMINPYFNIWDANWWPDFPTSAQKIMWFYQNFGGSTTDGVIAVNADLLGDLLKVTGSIEMPEYNVTITGDNLFTTLQDRTELTLDQKLTEPKAIIADLAPKLLEKLVNNKDEQKKTVEVLLKSLVNKNIQIYLSDENLQAKIKDFAWAGEVLKSSKDYLQVVNTNIGGGKTDLDIYQSIDHQVEIMANGDIIDTVKVTRTNKSTGNNPLAGLDGGNVSYLRFYTPKGSELLEAFGFDDFSASYFQASENEILTDSDVEAEEQSKMLEAVSQTEIFESLDKTVFANWLALKPGESKTVAIKYKLPFKLDIVDPLTNNWWSKIFNGDVFLDNYSLLVQSQAGSKNTIFNSSVLLPDNLKVVWNQSSDIEKMSVNNKLVTYTSDLLGDQYFGFILSSK